MTTNSKHHVQPKMTRPKNRHHRPDRLYRITPASLPKSQTRTDTCHPSGEAAGSVVTTPC